MKKVTIKDFRLAVQKVAKNRQTNELLASLSDEELFKVNIERDLHVFHGQIGSVIRQISEDKQVLLPFELHKVLRDKTVSTLVDTVNFCIQEEVKLGVNIDIKR